MDASRLLTRPQNTGHPARVLRRPGGYMSIPGSRPLWPRRAIPGPRITPAGNALHLLAGVIVGPLLCLGLMGSGARAGDLPAGSFSACLVDLGRTAEAEGVAPAVVGESLAQVRFRPRIIELDRSQPEFTTPFADYLGRRVTDARVEQGRQLLARHRDLLERIYRDYGVPPRYLVAFWGMETNYGGYFGETPVLDALATLACDGRRGEYFTRQLVAALRIIEEGSAEPDRMTGSWAGAMGHVQFMPTAFLDHAVDYDGDGRRDLWGSVPDAMASAANFLSALGWQGGWRWGREVLLPPEFDFARAGVDQPRSQAQWRGLGLRTAYGRPLPDADVEATLRLPAGHRGPAFLVYDNFDVIMGWNRSEFYALAVGHLADRLAGAGPLVRPPPADAPRLSRDQVIRLQQRLQAYGFDSGPADGIPGPRTRAALRRFQEARGLVADGFASREVLSALAVADSRSD